ncbi:hypothetical protein GRF29_106g436842 [Pseudopithomyces chartarum]|uniref:Uncharacterized protein n=1 Tax=Pseudopithomyces chartarum TaxID=1892770 RepID=A0AAN6LUZ1_9PLEO|nr:hypothetical protein GRF29_106g436842 [Pseudopithomyces chartarum]
MLRVPDASDGHSQPDVAIHLFIFSQTPPTNFPSQSFTETTHSLTHSFLPPTQSVDPTQPHHEDDRSTRSRHPGLVRSRRRQSPSSAAVWHRDGARDCETCDGGTASFAAGCARAGVCPTGQPLGGAGLLLPSFPPPAFPPVPLAIPNLPSSLPKLSLVDTLPLTLPTGLPKLPTPDILTLPKLPLEKISLPLPLPTGLKVPVISDLSLPKLPLPDIAISKLPSPTSPSQNSLPSISPPLNSPFPTSPPQTAPPQDPPPGHPPHRPLRRRRRSRRQLRENREDGLRQHPQHPRQCVQQREDSWVPARCGPRCGTCIRGGCERDGAFVCEVEEAPGWGDECGGGGEYACGWGGGLLGGLTGGLAGGLTGGIPVVGGAAAPVLNTVGGVTSGSSPLGAVGSTVGGVASTVGGVAGSVPVVGGAIQGVTNTVGSTLNSALPGPYPLGGGFPGSDPVGGLSISIIATLLSLLKKDPLSLFGGLGGTGGLLKRDVPELAEAFEIEKRQLAGLPSLSTGIPGIGIGALPLSGIPGVSPDLAFLVGSIAKNIAVPGGKGLGSVTGNILSVLNGVVPNFLFKLPVVQDSVPTFGALQLLSSINPAKFGSLADLTNLASLSQAAAGISAGDLAFVKTLPNFSGCEIKRVDFLLLSSYVAATTNGRSCFARPITTPQPLNLHTLIELPPPLP